MFCMACTHKKCVILYPFVKSYDWPVSCQPPLVPESSYPRPLINIPCSCDLQPAYTNYTSASNSYRIKENLKYQLMSLVYHMNECLTPPGKLFFIGILHFSYITPSPDPQDPVSGVPRSRIPIFIHPRSQIPDPRPWIPDLGSQIPDSTTAPKEERKFFLSYYFCSHKYHKIVNNFTFEQVEKIYFPKTLRIIALYTQKFVIMLSKIWVWDQGSRIRDPGSRILFLEKPKNGQKGTGSWITARITVLYN